MPVFMTKCDLVYAQEVDHAIGITKAAEDMAILVAGEYRPLHHTRIEYLYELAYLKAFIGWEAFLEASLIRYMCGHHSRKHGPESMVGGKHYYKSLNDAELAMLDGSDYLLWGNTKRALTCVRKNLLNSRHEMVIAGSKGSLDQFATIRHRIAHNQAHACGEFDKTCMALAFRRNFGQRPGRFLRAWNTSVVPNVRWIEWIATTLKGLASAIA